MAPPEVWGPPVWNFIHTLAEKVNEDSFNSIKVGLFSIIKRICINLPCPECSQHANHFLMKVNIFKIHSKSEFKHMLFVFHNAVNKRKRKQMVVYTNIIDRYKYMTIPNTYNNFINVYNTKGNLNLIMESFQRSFVIKDLEKWLYLNHTHFKPRPNQRFINTNQIAPRNQINKDDHIINVINNDMVDNVSIPDDNNVMVDNVSITDENDDDDGDDDDDDGDNDDDGHDGDDDGDDGDDGDGEDYHDDDGYNGDDNDDDGDDGDGEDNGDNNDGENFKSIINNETFNIDDTSKEIITEEEVIEESKEIITEEEVIEESKEIINEEEVIEESKEIITEEEFIEENKEIITEEEVIEESKEIITEEETLTEYKINAITEDDFESIDEEDKENVIIPESEENLDEVINTALEIIKSYKIQDNV
jgi:hypothetical protein